MKKWFLLLTLWPGLAFAAPPTAYHPCESYIPGVGGYYCLENGASSMWQTFSGDITEYTGPACSPTNIASCGHITVNGVQGQHFSLQTPSDGQCWVYNATDVQWEPSACGVTSDASGLKFGATTIPNGSSAPTTNQCLQFDGTHIVGGNCGSVSPGGVANSVQYNNGSSFSGTLLAMDQALMGSISAPQAVGVNNCSTALSYSTTTHAFGCTALGAAASLGLGTGLTSSGGNIVLNMAGGGPTSHQFATALSATGTLSLARPLCADLSDASTGCSTTVGALASLNVGTGLSSGSVNLNLANTAVTPGTYTLLTATIDQQGRITAASNGTGAVPNGSVNQLVGYSATNTGESQTIGGDATYARTGANAGSLTVTGTHLSAALPVNQGGTGTTSTLTGLMRGNASAMTAAEISGDGTTSGSNAITVTKSNGNLFTSATFGATLNLSTLLSQDCTISSGGVVTCTKAGNGTGSFTAGTFSSTGTAPTVSSCGTGAAIATNSTDNGGHVAVGSTASTVACTITWHGSYTNAPDCNVMDRTTYQSLTISSISNTAMTFNAQISMTNDTVGWVCFFHG